ncbi:energy transducer TonB [Pseudomonas matsuisoli]|uniref:Transporter TonB n=1 Tax=Pseudomonas matsuisoli TaxID=1515666 RepID=A0A917PZK0_9PSED|nr:energy transducer TonB [Pseudomonas matsuisoli]GGK02919.1 transporter TonB [Pseudomonas matsuisoli]
MNAAVKPTRLNPEPVRSSDRLGFTLFLAAVLHVAVILGVGFTLSDPLELSKTLEVTLATFKSDQAPDNADFLAQHNQQGSGTLEEKAVPKTTQQAAFQDTEVNEVSPPSSPPPATQQLSPKTAIATRSPQREKTPATTDERDEAPTQEAPTTESEPLTSEISSLEAELANEVERYAKRPRIYRINAASTMQDKGASYKEDWRKRIERVGNLNYPGEARRDGIYGSLRLLVSINKDGTLYEVQILESSGKPVLDQAALRIVRLAAPFSPFTGDLSDIDRLEIIRTWRFERGDRLSSQ